MLWGYLASFAFNIEFESINLTGQGDEKIAKFVEYVGRIIVALAFLAECLLFILYPIAKIAKKFKYPFLYFFMSCSDQK